MAYLEVGAVVRAFWAGRSADVRVSAGLSQASGFRSVHRGALVVRKLVKYIE